MLPRLYPNLLSSSLMKKLTKNAQCTWCPADGAVMDGSTWSLTPVATDSSTTRTESTQSACLPPWRTRWWSVTQRRATLSRRQPTSRTTNAFWILRTKTSSRNHRLTSNWKWLPLWLALRLLRLTARPEFSGPADTTTVRLSTSIRTTWWTGPMSCSVTEQDDYISECAALALKKGAHTYSIC